MKYLMIFMAIVCLVFCPAAFGALGMPIDVDSSSATVIVTAVNSRNPTSADYICDGVADDETIQTALNALPAGGGKVICREGDYVFKGSMTIPDDYVTLEFTAGNTVKIVADGNTLSYVTKNTNDVYYLIGAFSKRGVKIKGVNMDWEAGATQTKFPPSRSYAGIWLEDCDTSEIVDCNVANVVKNGELTGRQWGILASNCRDFLIDNCYAWRCGYEGIGVRQASTRGIVSRCGGGGNSVHLAQASSWSPTSTGPDPNFITFTENVVSGTGSSADEIIIHGTKSHNAGNDVITNNTVASIRVIGEVNGLTISGNIIKTTGAITLSNSGTGVDCILENVIISNNQSVQNNGGPDSYGVKLESAVCATTAGKLRNVTIADNVFRNRYVYLTTITGGNSNIENVSIIGNEFYNDDADVYQNVWLQTAGNGSILGTRIGNNRVGIGVSTARGVGLGTDSNGTIANTHIIGNSFNGGLRQIYLEETVGQITDVFISGNQMSCTDGSLIRTIGTPQNIFFQDNDANLCKYIATSSSGTPAGLLIKDNYISKIETSLISGTFSNMVVKGNYGDAKCITETDGNSVIADGGTITHGLAGTPTYVIATGSVASEIVTVTAVSSTTFTVAIKKDDGSAGTSQNIYWRAVYKP